MLGQEPDRAQDRSSELSDTYLAGYQQIQANKKVRFPGRLTGVVSPRFDAISSPQVTPPLRRPGRTARRPLARPSQTSTHWARRLRAMQRTKSPAQSSHWSSQSQASQSQPRRLRLHLPSLISFHSGSLVKQHLLLQQLPSGRRPLAGRCHPAAVEAPPSPSWNRLLLRPTTLPASRPRCSSRLARATTRSRKHRQDH